MKKLKIISFILLLAVLSVAFYGCTTLKDLRPSTFLKEPNLAENATFYDSLSRKKSFFSLKNSTTDCFYIAFDYETTLNTIALFGDATKIDKFQISAVIDNIEQIIYEQDYLDTFRYITFPKIKTKLIKVTVFSSNKFELNKIQIFNVEDKKTSFRQTTYLVCESVKNSNLDEGHFKNLTDIILFGSANFDNKGNIDINIEDFETALNKVRNMEETLNKKFNIYINFLSYQPNYVSTDWNKKQKELGDYVRGSFDENKEKFIKNILLILNKYQLDGVAFDYEYPVTNKDYKSYSNFLIALKAKLGDRKLAVALSVWGLKISSKAKKAIDVLELMTYDSADVNGNHSAFYNNTVIAIQTALNAGFKKEQIDIGIPFYSRPKDMSELWIGYKDEYEKLEKYGNFVPTPYLDVNGNTLSSVGRYYNGYQMVYDKIRFSKDFGIGGAMVWHYACDVASDNELSLFNAMNNAINYK